MRTAVSDPPRPAATLRSDAVRAFRADLALLIEVVWVDRELHVCGLDLLLDRQRTRLR